MFNPKEIARFEKISFEQFEKDMQDLVQEGIVAAEDLKSIYDNIKLPKRATKKSVGHDFWLPFNIALYSDEEIIIPTGIKCFFYEDMDELYSLDLYPRSGQGFVYKIQIKNTVGIIDMDFYGNIKTEGHIKVALFNDGDKKFILEAGKGFCQGLFHEAFIAAGNHEEDIDTERIGGTGSSDLQK